MGEELIQKYEAARRDLLALWTAKRRLLLAAQSRSPTSHPLFHALLKEDAVLTGDYNIHWLEHWLETNLT